MDKVHPDLSAVINRFPDRRESLRRLFLKSKRFQSVCEDYRNCRDAWFFWSRSDQKGAAAAVEEYTTLLGELEAEILECLDENAG